MNNYSRYIVNELNVIEIEKDTNLVNLEFHGLDGEKEVIFFLYFKCHDKEDFTAKIKDLNNTDKIKDFFVNVFIDEGHYDFNHEISYVHIHDIFDDDELICKGIFHKDPYESERNYWHIYDNAYLYSLFNTIDDMKVLKDYLLENYPNLKNL